MQARAKQRFADVDVAQPSDAFLVQQKGLERRARRRQQGAQPRDIQFSQGIWPQPSHLGQGIDIPTGRHPAEPARIHEAQFVAACQRPHHMGVRGARLGRGLQAQPTGHSQMNQDPGPSLGRGR